MNVAISVPVEYADDFKALDGFAPGTEKVPVSGLDGIAVVQWVIPLVVSGALGAVGEQLVEVVFNAIRRAASREKTEVARVTHRVSITINGIAVQFETEDGLRSKLTK